MQTHEIEKLRLHQSQPDLDPIIEKLKDKDKQLLELRHLLSQKEEVVNELSLAKSKYQDQAFKFQTEVERLNVENEALLKRNKELNTDIDKMHRQLKEVETHRHGEQSEWISKYHDQIEKVKHLENLWEQIAGEH